MKNGLMAYAEKFGIEVEIGEGVVPVKNLELSMKIEANLPPMEKADPKDLLAEYIKAQSKNSLRKYRMYHRNDVVWSK
jgi:hypothetical protein